VKFQINKKPYKRAALVLSLCALIAWGVIGTGVTLAYMANTPAVVNEINHGSDSGLEVYHLLADGGWEAVGSETKIFSDGILWEPGRVQVAYLKVENNGTFDFNFDVEFNVSSNEAFNVFNVFNNTFRLQDYLEFGAVITDEAYRIPDRESAVNIADSNLRSFTTEKQVLVSKQAKYIALVIRMPEEVGNEANYRGDNAPKVEFGIKVTANQI